MSHRIPPAITCGAKNFQWVKCRIRLLQGSWEILSFPWLGLSKKYIGKGSDTYNFPIACTLNQETTKPSVASRWSLLTPCLPSLEKIILICSTGNRGQAEDGCQQAYPGLQALKIHVSTGFYWNSFLFWKGMRKGRAESSGNILQKFFHNEITEGGRSGGQAAL